MVSEKMRRLSRWVGCLRLALLAGVVCLAAFALVTVWRGLFVTGQGPLTPDTTDRFAHQKPAVGEPAPDFTLREPDGREYRLSEHVGRPVVLEFGSVT
jgi:hypothetical protein